MTWRKADQVYTGDRFHHLLESGLRIALSESGTSTTVHLEGELDLAEEQEVRDAVRATLKRRPVRLVVDLSRLSFIDSSGVHVLIETTQQCAAQDTDLRIVPGPPSVNRIFEICDLTHRLPFSFPVQR